MKGLSLRDVSGLLDQPSKEVKENTKVKDRITKLIMLHVEQPREQQLMTLLNKTEFWRAPASSNKAYHGSFEGGLAIHTALVVEHMLSLNDAWKTDVSTDSIVTVGILHDIAKAGVNGELYYVPEFDKDGLIKRYSKNKAMVSTGQNVLSLYIAAQNNISLSILELEAIMGQDGMFSHEGKSVFDSGKKVGALTYLMHFADWFVAGHVGV